MSSSDDFKSQSLTQLNKSSEFCSRIALNYNINGHCLYLYKRKKSTGCTFEDKHSGEDTNYLKCEYCHVIVHLSCKEKIDFVCKTSSLRNSVEEAIETGLGFELHHYFVKKSDLNTGKKIWKCCWCHKVVSDDPTDKPLEFCNKKEEHNLLFVRYGIKDTESISLSGSETLPESRKNFFCIGENPTFVFINRKSGSKNGGNLVRKFSWQLTADQVGDLSCQTPKEYLNKLKDIGKLHLVICGGDGTVGWVLDDVHKCNLGFEPTVSIMPLGTGNDLSRCLKWGKAYKGTPVISHMITAKNGKDMHLDRWLINIESISPSTAGEIKCYSMQNYFSIGMDAKVVHSFHKWRENQSSDRGSRLMNKAIYAQKGAIALVKNYSKQLTKNIGSFYIDEKDRYSELASFKPGSLLFLNIGSYSSGTNPWGNRNSEVYQQPMYDDGRLEVMFLQQFDLIKLQVGGSSHRFAQCETARMRVDDICFAQIDGEPVSIEHSIVTVSLMNKVHMKIPHND